MKTHGQFLQIVALAVSELEDPWKEFFRESMVKLAEIPAAVKYHHNFKGGLLRHVAEMLEFGLPLLETAKINRQNFIRAVLLHDYAKLKTYKFDKAGNIRYEKLQYPVEFWTLNELAKKGLSLQDEELNALALAEGGWSEYKNLETQRLAGFLHVCDMWSSNVIKPRMIVNCPKCGVPMVLRTGPRGDFYGCATFPNCNGSMELRDAALKLDEPTI